MTHQMRRVLIVEDNALVGEHVASIVHQGGYVPIGPLLTVQEAQDVLDSFLHSFDAALLDLYLDGTTETLAHRLMKLGIPFAFATGNRAQIPADLRDWPVCEKPFSAHGILSTLKRMFERETEVGITAEILPFKPVSASPLHPEATPRPA